MLVLIFALAFVRAWTIESEGKQSLSYGKNDFFLESSITLRKYNETGSTNSSIQLRYTYNIHYTTFLFQYSRREYLRSETTFHYLAITHITFQ